VVKTAAVVMETIRPAVGPPRHERMIVITGATGMAGGGPTVVRRTLHKIKAIHFSQ